MPLYTLDEFLNAAESGSAPRNVPIVAGGMPARVILERLLEQAPVPIPAGMCESLPITVIGDCAAHDFSQPGSVLLERLAAAIARAAPIVVNVGPLRLGEDALPTDFDDEQALELLSLKARVLSRCAWLHDQDVQIARPPIVEVDNDPSSPDGGKVLSIRDGNSGRQLQRSRLVDTGQRVTLDGVTHRIFANDDDPKWLQALLAMNRADRRAAARQSRRRS